MVEQQLHHAPPHTKWVGTTQSPAYTERAPTRGHEAENLGWRSPLLPRRVRGAAASPIPDDTPSEALAGVEMEVEEEFEPAPRRWKEYEAPTRGGQNVLFLCSFFLFLSFGGKGSPTRTAGFCGCVFLLVILYFISRNMRRLRRCPKAAGGGYVFNRIYSLPLL